MRYTALVMKAAMRANFRSPAVAAVIAGVALMCAAGLAVLFGTLFIRPEVARAAPDRSVLENHVGLVMFATSFVCIGIYASVFTFQSLTREKDRGCIQALLATPVAPRDVWLGKSLGVFLPGLAFAVVTTLAAFLGVSYTYLIPDIGFIITPWMIITSFVAVPLVYLAMTLVVHLVGLTGRPATGNVIAQVFLPVMMSLMINLAVRKVPSAASWVFTVALLGVAAAAGIIVLLLRSKLTAERITLSR